MSVLSKSAAVTIVDDDDPEEGENSFKGAVNGSNVKYGLISDTSKNLLQHALQFCLNSGYIEYPPVELVSFIPAEPAQVTGGNAQCVDNLSFAIA